MLLNRPIHQIYNAQLVFFLFYLIVLFLFFSRYYYYNVYWGGRVWFVRAGGGVDHSNTGNNREDNDEG